jgi:DNA-binding NtrC family response regulator
MSAVRAAPATLVIIDDNPGSLELLSNALAQDDLEILVASDPEAGLDLIYDRHPQIVITDLVMPGMSGMEVLDRIVEFDPSTDVILMTAHYSTESAVEAIRKGASDYLNKPISLATLRTRVGALLEESRRRWRTLRQQSADVGHVLPDPPGSAALSHRAGDGRNRVGQGTGGAGDPSAQSRRAKPLRSVELLRSGGNPV